MKKILHTKMAGFTLIEALIAALVVGVGMLGLAKLQGELFISSSESRMRTHALNLAQDKIEEFRKVVNKDKYDEDFAVGTTYTDTKSAGSGSSSENFTREWVITDHTNPNYKQISVKVTWTDSKNVTQTVKLTSNVATPEPVKTGVLLESPDSCSALVTAAIVTGEIVSNNILAPLFVGLPLAINTNPLAVCTVLTINTLYKGKYICTIQNLDPAIVKLSFGGKEIDLSVNVALSDIPRLLPPGGLLSSLTGLLSNVITQLQTLQTKLGLPPKLVCVKAHLDLPIKIDTSGNITAG